ncbi:hypothetical protein LSAT2_017846, partial [Lamellibrachia satsuma]
IGNLSRNIALGRNTNGHFIGSREIGAHAAVTRAVSAGCVTGKRRALSKHYGIGFLVFLAKSGPRGDCTRNGAMMRATYVVVARRAIAAL